MNFTSKSSRPDNISPISILRNRELYGAPCRKKSIHPGAMPSRIFSNKIPNRLIYSLKDLVSIESLIDEAHVFLGFNSEGTMVLSYTETFEAEEMTAFPTYVYRLYWWLFRFNKKLVKLAVVRLFANEEISSSLLLTYSEWPQTKSKIIVYGSGSDTDSCYITVAAVPPLSRCEDCDVFATSKHPIENQRCFEHGFSVHMKHTSVSSHTTILNSNGLNIDNLIVLNMGHSIGVISLGILNNEHCHENLPLSTIRRATFGEKVASSESEELSSDNLEASESKTEEICKSAPMEASLSEELSKSFKVADFHDVYSFPQNEAWVTVNQNINLKESTSSTQPLGKLQCVCSNQMPPPSVRLNNAQNVLTKSSGAAGVDPYLDYYSEPESIVLSQTSTSRPCVTFSSSESYKYRNENFCCGLHSSSKNVQQHGSSPSFTGSNRTIHKRPRIGLSRTRRVSQGSDNDSDKMPLSPVQDCSITFKSSDNEVLCTYCGLRISSKSLCSSSTKALDGSSKKPGVSQLRGSPSISKIRKLLINKAKDSSSESWHFSVDLNAPTPSPSASESSGSIYCLGDTGPFSTANTKYESNRNGDGVVSFIETLYEELPSENGTNDSSATLPSDENSLFYGPVTFQNSTGTPMSPCQSNVAPGSMAFSQHLVLDIEHVIFDVLRTRCYVTYKFGLLIDYDVQIINTCPGIRSVIVFIVALLDVSPKRKREGLQRASLHMPSSSKTYLREIQFFLCWRLQTGRYEVVAASPLRHCSEKNSGKWDASWTSEVCAKVRRVSALPQSPPSVYSLDNSAVASGKSLALLWDPDRMMAIGR